MPVRWPNESAFIASQRRRGADTVLEPLGLEYRPDQHEYIMVCGVGARIVWIRWYARDIDEARRCFLKWLTEPWQRMTHDIYGNAVTEGYQFKPGRVDWFAIAD